MFDQTGNAFCAADTARSTSARSPSATFANRLSSCGFRTSNVLPDAAGTNLLSMNRLVLTWMFGSVSGMKPLPKGVVYPTIASRLCSRQRLRCRLREYRDVLDHALGIRRPDHTPRWVVWGLGEFESFLDVARLTVA